MSERVKSIIEACGAVALVAGIALIYVPAALIVGGLVLIAMGNL